MGSVSGRPLVAWRQKFRFLPVRGDDRAQAQADGLGDGDEFLGLLGREVDGAVARPESQPGLEVSLLQLEGNVFPRHAAGVTPRAAEHAGPEIGNLFQVRRPVGDMGGENRSDFVVLAHVGVKMLEQLHQRFPSADAVEESGGGWKSHG